MSLAFVDKRDFTVFDRKKSVVTAHGDVLSREDTGASLAHEDRAHFGEGSRSDLDSQIFWIGIAAVFGLTS